MILWAYEILASEDNGGFLYHLIVFLPRNKGLISRLET